MENKGKYRKLSLQDLDVKTDSQTRTHLTTSNNAPREEAAPSLHENAERKGSKCQAVFQGRVWTAKWQVISEKGSPRSCTPRRSPRRDRQDCGGVRSGCGLCPDRTAAQGTWAPRGGRTPGRLREARRHRVENKTKTAMTTLTKVKNKAYVKRMKRSHCEAQRKNRFA